MMYLKFSTGEGGWRLLEAEQLDWSTTLLQVPSTCADGDENGSRSYPDPDLNWAEFLRDKGVKVHEHATIDAPFMRPDVPDFVRDDCVKWVRRLAPNGVWWTHVYQGDAYVLGEDGKTLERL